MVLARHAAAASELSKQIRENVFQKEYLAVLHGVPPKSEGQLRDLLYRDKTRHMTMVAQEPGKGIQEAILDYWVLGSVQNMTRVRVLLHTGRTHQIRVQFASRGLSLIGERKYAQWNDPCELALFSSRLCFMHPETGRKMEFHLSPPEVFPWTEV